MYIYIFFFWHVPSSGSHLIYFIFCRHTRRMRNISVIRYSSHDFDPKPKKRIKTKKGKYYFAIPHSDTKGHHLTSHLRLTNYSLFFRFNFLRNYIGDLIGLPTGDFDCNCLMAQKISSVGLGPEGFSDRTGVWGSCNKNTFPHKAAKVLALF